MSCKKCKRLPEDLLKLEYVIIDEVDVTPFSYDKDQHDSSDNFISLGFVHYKIADEVKAGNTVNYDGKIYIPYLDSGQVLVKIDNEQKFRDIFNEHQHIVDYFVKNKGKVLKTADIPVEFDCFKRTDPYFPCIRTVDDSVDLYVCQTNIGGGIKYGNSYSFLIKLASLTLRDPKVVTESSSVSKSGETTTHIDSEKPRKLTQDVLLNSPRSEVITRWYNDKGSNIHFCNECLNKYGEKSRPFSHIFGNFKYIVLTKVTPCEFSVPEPSRKQMVHHSNVPLKVKGTLEPGKSVVHDNFIYTYEKDTKNLEYFKVRNDSDDALLYYNKYSHIVKDISEYVGRVIEPKELGITKDVYAQDVPVIYMGKDNIGIVIKKTSDQWSRVLTILAKIEFQIVFA